LKESSVATAAKKAAGTTAADTAKPKVAAKPKAAPKETASAPIEAPVAAAKPAKASKPSKPSKSVASISGVIANDAELQKMPESDYMNEVQMAYFKAKLEVMRDEILDNARETGDHLKENEVFADPNDRATVEEENMLEQRVRDRERKLLKKITTALVRIADGSYGYCLETGDPIGIPRLLARPTAELSIEAQEKHERLEKLYAD
jgi:DnaK suppressor protein